MVTDAGNQALPRNAFCEAYRDFERLGLSGGSAGNVSVRWSGGMLISPAGATAATAAPGMSRANLLQLRYVFRSGAARRGGLSTPGGA